MIRFTQVHTTPADADNQKETYPLTQVDWEINIAEKRILSTLPGQGLAQFLQLLRGETLPHAGTINAFDLDLQQYNKLTRLQWMAERISILQPNQPLNPQQSILQNLLRPVQRLQKNPLTYETRAKALLAYLGMFNKLTVSPSQLNAEEIGLVKLARGFILQPALVVYDLAGSTTSQQKWLHKLISGTQTALLLVDQSAAPTPSFSYPVDHLLHGKMTCAGEPTPCTVG